MKRLSYRLLLVLSLLLLVPSPKARAEGWWLKGDGQLVLETLGSVLGQETEVERASPSPVKLEVKLGQTFVRLEKGAAGFKLKLENSLGQEVKKMETTGGSYLLKIDRHQDDDAVKISTHSANRLLLSRRRLGAITDLPISVSLQTNQLIVSTQAGSRVVAVLPDQAIEKLLSEKLLDKVGGLNVSEILSEASPSSNFAEAVELKVDSGGEPVYEILGSKLIKVLGFWPFSLPRKIIISAQTGAVEKVQEPLLIRFLNLISL